MRKGKGGRRGKWALLALLLMATALVALLGGLRDAREEEPRAAPPREASPARSGEEGAGAPQEEAASAGALPEIRLAGEGGSPALTLVFADPAAGVPEAPSGGYADICGPWVLEMSAPAYGIENCHLLLERDGTISSPPDYDPAFRIADSSYAWRAGERSFSASFQALMMLGPGQSLVPLRMDLAGEVAEGMDEIRGTFTAQPGGEAHALYAQQGSFSLLRR